MASFRKTLILEQQDNKKTTISPTVLNEMSHNQIDMVSGSFGVIANNTNLSVFASNFSAGTAPILVNKNSNIEVEQSIASDKNNMVDNSKFVVAIDNNNNIQVDDASESGNRITRKSATDDANTTNFPSPNPGYADFTTALVINSDTENVIAAGEIVNNGIDTLITSPSAGILLKDAIVDLSESCKAFNNEDLSTDVKSLIKFIQNLPKDLNGKTITFIFNNNFPISADSLIFEKFYGGTISIQGAYNGRLEFVECDNITFNDFTFNENEEYNYTSLSGETIDSNRIILKYCKNVIVQAGTFNSSFEIYNSKCHFKDGTFIGSKIKDSDKRYAIIHKNENSQVLFDYCITDNNMLAGTLHGSQISSVDAVSATTADLLYKNFHSEDQTDFLTVKDAENMANHFHIAAEHVTSESYPIGAVYGWPRTYTRGDIKRAIAIADSTDWQVGVFPTISGLTSNYLPSGDLPLDMSGPYDVSPYRNSAINYKNTFENITPAGIQTYTPITSFCSFDWYKLYSMNTPVISAQFSDNYGVESIYNTISNLDTIANSPLITEKPINNDEYILDGVYFELASVDMLNVHARKRAWARLTFNINNNGFYVTGTTSNSGNGVSGTYNICLSGLAKVIPEPLQKFVVCEYTTNDGVQHVTGCTTQNLTFSTPLNITWSISNVVLKVPYVSITGKIYYAIVSVNNCFRNISDSNSNIYIAKNEDVNYNNVGNRRYDYDFPIQYPKTKSYIIMSPAVRNMPKLTVDDWYIFSDTILNVKTSNNYKPKKFNNYYDEYLTYDNDVSEITSNNYFAGTFTRYNKVINNIAKESGMNNYYGTYTTDTGFNTFINGVALPISGYYSYNNELYIVSYNSTQFINAKYQATLAAVGSLNMNISYNRNEMPQYVKNGDIIYDYTILPLELRANSNINVSSFTFNNLFISDYNTSIASTDVSPFRFHPELSHAIIRHNFMRSCEEFLTSINGIIIDDNSFTYNDVRNYNDYGQYDVRNPSNTKWPPNNYMNGLSNEALNIFNGTVGMAYPLLTGDLISNTLINMQNYSFYDGTNTSYNIPWSKAPTQFSTPQYYGIPYISGIFYQIDNGAYSDCTSYLGGQPEISNYIATAMPPYDNYNLNSSTSEFMKSSIPLITVNNLHKIREKLIAKYGNSVSGNSDINLNIVYNRDFYFIPNIADCIVSYSDGSFSDSAGRIDRTNSDTISNVFINLSNIISRSHNNGIIKFLYNSTDNSPEFAHYYTNVNNNNYSDIIDILKSVLFYQGQTYTYSTTIHFSKVWDWNIFYQTYMHKLYFVISKLNAFYKTVFTDSNKNNFALNNSFANIVNFNQSSLYFGNSNKYEINVSNITFNDINNDIKNFTSLVGQMYYPIGNYTDNRTTDLSGNVLNLGITMLNNNSFDKKDKEFFTDANNWAENDFSMKSILNTSNRCKRVR